MGDIVSSVIIVIILAIIISIGFIAFKKKKINNKQKGYNPSSKSFTTSKSFSRLP